MKTIFTGIAAIAFAFSVNAQVPEKDQNIQKEEINETTRAGMDDYSWDPVYTENMSIYERNMNNDYGLLMGKMQLSEEQKNQLKKISDNSRMQMMEMYRNPDLTNEQLQEKHSALLDERRKQITGILTAEQRKQYDTWYTSNPVKEENITWRKQWAMDNMSLEKMRERLSLTDEQFEKLKQMDASYAERKMAITSNTGISADERKTQMKALMTEKRTAYRALLNADQIEKLKVEKDGDIKIKTKEGNETKKIKVKTQGTK